MNRRYTWKESFKLSFKDYWWLPLLAFVSMIGLSWIISVDGHFLEVLKLAAISTALLMVVMYPIIICLIAHQYHNTRTTKEIEDSHIDLMNRIAEKYGYDVTKK